MGKIKSDTSFEGSAAAFAPTAKEAAQDAARNEVCPTFREKRTRRLRADQNSDQHKFEKKVPEENLFWTLVFLRMIIPIDGVSYLFGLFSKMSLKSYTIATIIGLIPFSFAVAYMGSMPIQYQIILGLIAGIIFMIGILIAYYKKRGFRNLEKIKNK